MSARWSVVWCPVEDMEGAVAFYRDVLGVEVVSENPYWSELRVGGVRLALHQGGEGVQKGGWTVCLEVDDLEDLRKRLEAAGVECASEYHDTPSGPSLAFRDPDGNRLQALQPRS
ncbi:MAG: hypothetical protein KatS3mg015_2011 [Fimbriimonadales bacterium]|nr:MAG: hypothetical protein KatS3mg015_2011 [Fimbriimonadales bacterium]